MPSKHSLEVVKRPSLLFRRVRVLGGARLLAKRAVAGISKAVWRVPLDRERTVRTLRPYQVSRITDGVVVLPERTPTNGDRLPALGQHEIVFEPEHVWQIERNSSVRSMRITSSGTVLLNNRLLLDTDFGSLPGIADLPWKERRVEVDVAIVPWAHKWRTYYEFVIHVLSKLCLIRETVDPRAWAAAKVCYPVQFGFERQFLSLFGLDPDACVDPGAGVEIVARSIVVSNLQSESRLPTPSRIGALRRAFLKEASPSDSHGVGLYLSRAGGSKRQVRNEAEVREVISALGLEVIEPSRLAVAEQIRMFSEAPVIVAPHGSALTNIVWCSPGTRVVELFSRSFTPPMFAYMSHVLGMPYSCLVDNATESHHWVHRHKDMGVDVRALASLLDEHP